MRFAPLLLAFFVVASSCGDTTRLVAEGTPTAGRSATLAATPTATPTVTAAPTPSPSPSPTPTPTIDPATCPRGVPCATIATSLASVNPYLLDGHLNALTSFVSRDPRHPGHAKAKAYIKEQVGAIGAYRIESQQTVYNGIPLENIFATIEPSPGFTSPAGGAVLVSAHYDSTANRTAGWRPSVDPAPGADDNATGTAGLIELARVIAGYRAAGQLRARIVLAFFDGEELFFKGSGAYMATLQKPYPYRAAINLDMVGFNPLADRLDLLWYTSASAGLRDRVLKANDTYKIGVSPLNAQYAADGNTIMDAAPFGIAGIPSIALCQRYGENDATFPGNYTFHTVTDTPDKITNKRLWLKATKLTLATALELASEAAQ